MIDREKFEVEKKDGIIHRIGEKAKSLAKKAWEKREALLGAAAGVAAGFAAARFLDGEPTARDRFFVIMDDEEEASEDEDDLDNGKEETDEN